MTSDLPAGEGAGGGSRCGEPGQAFIAEADGAGSVPAAALQPQRRRAVGPGEREADDGGAEHPGAEPAGDDQRQDRVGDGDVEAPAAGHAARGNDAVRLVDGVDLAVVPVVDRLAGAADERTGEQDAGRRHRASGRPSATPDETTPQPKAHIGANQVIGFSSSMVAARLGTEGDAVPTRGLARMGSAMPNGSVYRKKRQYELTLCAVGRLRLPVPRSRTCRSA